MINLNIAEIGLKDWEKQDNIFKNLNKQYKAKNKNKNMKKYYKNSKFQEQITYILKEMKKIQKKISSERLNFIWLLLKNYLQAQIILRLKTL